jgi:HEPN domain-containing protein
MSPRKWNLLYSEHLAAKPPAEQFAAYAFAYIDSAERLCRTLARSHRSATYERGTVVLFLAQHAIELFLKGAILRKSPVEKPTHNLEALYARYRKLYPAKWFDFSLAFTTNYAGMSKSEIAASRKTQPPIDQLFRYPREKSGVPWPGLYAFEANSFNIELQQIRAAFERLLHEYEI